MKKITTILMVLIAISMTTYSQWSLQTNPLGSGSAAMVGKVQFVSSTEGWIACGSNGSLLHTTNGGTNWSVVTPFPVDTVVNMSDPATTMSWVNPTHGWALKTYMPGTDDFSVDANGAVLYGTTDGGSNWTKKTFPKAITTTLYTKSDLSGSWQFYALTAKNPSVTTSISGWMYGVASIDSNGSCSISISRSNGTTKSPTLSMGISSRGRITSNGSEIGFLSADKNTAFMTGDEDNGGYSIYIMQKKIASTTYTTSDLQGNWQMHGLSAGNASSQYSGWIHAALTADANGKFTGTAYGPDNNPVSINTTAVISSSGIISGLTSISSFTNGFMSADKKTFYLVMTGGNNDYNLVAFQKQLPTITYSYSDFQGVWRHHTLITMNTNNSLEDNIKTTGFITGIMKFNANGNGIVNNGSSSDSITLNIDNTGLISMPPVVNGSTNIHGYMSDDKNTMILTMNDVYGGYDISILQKDVSVSGDIGLQVQFADANTGWASIYNMIYEGFKLYKTTDGGTTWNVINGVNNPVGGFYHFVDTANGWLIGSSGSIDNGGMTNIFHTTDGGLSFALQASNIGNAKQIFFSDLLNGWVVGKNGLIMNTTDGGAHWSNVTNTGQVANSSNKSVFFLNANQGWISSGNDNTEGIGTRYVLATTNGGISWTTQPTPVTNDIFSLSFRDATHGWLTSDKGQIAHYSSENVQAKNATIIAGGLSAALTTTEKNTITSLVLKGTIDARDFKTMRDDMPMLTEIDLSGTTVTEYTGTLGTFYDASITTYPANTIPQRSFYYTATKTGKAGLTSFIFPASVTDIGIYAFRSSGITSISIPSTVTSIGYGNFFSCSNLTSVTIPSSVKYIDFYAFSSCNALTSIDLPSSVTSIGYGAFNRSGLRDITFSEGLLTIGDYAFQNCDSLSSVYIPSTVTHSGYCAFTYDNSLKSFSVSAGNLNYSSLDGILYNKTNQKLLCYPGGKGTDFVIPSTVSVIDTAAFEGSNVIRNVVIPTSVSNLSLEAFFWCTNLKTIDIPASVNFIGAYAFYNCISLTSITVHTGTPVNLSASDSVFNYVNKSSCALYVPSNSKNAYQTAYQWKDFANINETTAIPGVLDKRMNLYPNPASVGFYINTGEKINAVSIYNLNGEMILSKEVICDNFINISDLQPGMYLLKVQTENGIIVRKLIKK